jgi:hypothetical protein
MSEFGIEVGPPWHAANRLHKRPNPTFKTKLPPASGLRLGSGRKAQSESPPLNLGIVLGPLWVQQNGGEYCA